MRILDFFYDKLFKLILCYFIKLNLLIVFISLLLFNAVSPLYATETIVLNVTGKPPLNDPTQNGFMDRVALEAFRRLNVKLETVELPAERALINSNNGIIDGEMSRVSGLNKKYKNLIRVKEKIMSWEFVVYSRKKITLNKGWHSLTPYSVSIINGWKILEKNVPPEVELTKVKNMEQLFGMLKLYRSDLIIYGKWAGMHYLKSNKITDVKLTYPPLIVKDLFIYLNKKHGTLALNLAKSLKSMKVDGTYDKILSDTLNN